MTNGFCEIDESGEPDYEKWGWKQAKRLWWTGDKHELFLYKDGYVKYHREFIKQIAARYHIPAALLAGVAWTEAGGKPDEGKWGVWAGRIAHQFWMDGNMAIGALTYVGFGDHAVRKYLEVTAYIEGGWNFLGLARPPEKTSMGIVAMQMETAGDTIGVNMRPRRLSLFEQAEAYSRQAAMGYCLMHDSDNLVIAARHLRSLILYDYPDADTEHLTDEQWIVAGARYNRGKKRSKQDIIDSIHAQASADKELKSYASYGLALIKRRNDVRMLLNDF